jgi:1-acyl-sn-glycerol-3-phosphate acyltransferase
MGTVRASTILFLFTIITLPAMVLQTIMVLTRLPLRNRFPLWYHWLMCRLLNLRVHISGSLPAKGPLLLVSNHISWLDIPVLGSLVPLSFIAKKEVSTWPFIGLLARLQNTLFVDRERRTKVRHTTSEIETRLDADECVVLFAEGTSSDGNQVLPFKSALFSTIEPNEKNGHGHQLQTVTIVYTHVHGLPMNRQQRPAIAWYGDMELIRHAWGVLKGGPLDVHVHLSDPTPVASIGDRKKLADYAYTRVTEDFSRLLTARPRPVH